MRVSHQPPMSTTTSAAETLMEMSTVAATEPRSSASTDSQRTLLATLLARAQSDDIDDIEGCELVRVFHLNSRDPDLQHLYTYALKMPRFKKWAFHDARESQLSRLREAIIGNDVHTIRQLLSSCERFVEDVLEFRTDMAIIAMRHGNEEAWREITSRGDISLTHRQGAYLRAALTLDAPSEARRRAFTQFRAVLVEKSVSASTACAILGACSEQARESSSLMGTFVLLLWKVLEEVHFQPASQAPVAAPVAAPAVTDATSLRSLMQRIMVKSNADPLPLDEVLDIIRAVEPTALEYTEYYRMSVGRALVTVFGNDARKRLHNGDIVYCVRAKPQ